MSKNKNDPTIDDLCRRLISGSNKYPGVLHGAVLDKRLLEVVIIKLLPIAPDIARQLWRQGGGALFPEDRNRVVAFQAAAATNCALVDNDGSVKVDDDPVVSLGDDDGAYVQSWVWVKDEELQSRITDDSDQPSPRQDP